MRRLAHVAVALHLAARTAALLVVGVGTATASAAKRAGPFDNQDAFFSAPPIYYGIFDGVSQCPDSRAFAQTLAKTAFEELAKTEIDSDSWSEAAQLALSKGAEEAFEYSGCSTACLMRLELDGDTPRAGCYVLGDCGVMVIRQDDEEDGEEEEEAAALVVAGCTDAKFHENGAPYQLGGRSWLTDEVDDGEEFEIEISAGDTLIAFTDGLVNNLEQGEIAEIVNECEGQEAEELAKALVERAKDVQTVDDDVTVVAIRLGEGKGSSGAGSFEAVVTHDGYSAPARRKGGNPFAAFYKK